MAINVSLSSWQSFLPTLESHPIGSISKSGHDFPLNPSDPIKFEDAKSLKKITDICQESRLIIWKISIPKLWMDLHYEWQLFTYLATSKWASTSLQVSQSSPVILYMFTRWATSFAINGVAPTPGEREYRIGRSSSLRIYKKRLFIYILFFK